MKRDPQVEHGEKNLATRRDVEDFLHEIKKKCADDIHQRSEWESRLDLNYQRRYGELNRGVDWPFPGASDIVIPTIDEVIDGAKAGEVALFSNVRPVCAFMPGNMNGASLDLIRKIEYYWDLRLRYHVPDFFQELILGIDDRLSGGRCVFKSIYEFQSEIVYESIDLRNLPGRLRQFSVLPVGEAKHAEYIRQISKGQAAPITKDEFDKLREQIKTQVIREWGLDLEEPVDKKACEDLLKFFRSGDLKTQIKYKQIKKQYPRMIAIDPLHFIAPPYTTDLDCASRMHHRMWMTKDMIHQKMDQGGWSEQVGEELTKQKAGGYGSDLVSGLNAMEVSKQVRMGLAASEDQDLYEIYETHAIYDLDGDGVGERCIITWSPGSDLPLKFIANPFNHGQVPFTYIPYELNDRLYHSSRGIPEKIKDLDEEITQQHRAKLNRMMIANAPTFTMLRGSGLNPFKIRWLPGEIYQTNMPGALQAVQIPNLDISFDREQNILRAEIERYVGAPDSAITSPLGKPSSPRTAEELRQVAGIADKSEGYRTTLFMLGMQRVMNQLWALEQQYGPKEIFMQVTGMEPIYLTKKEIQGKFVVIPRGTVVNSSPQMEAQKVLSNLGVLAQFAPLVMNDPRYKIDVGKALSDFLQLSDPLMAQRIIQERSPQELQQFMAAQQAALQKQNAAQNNDPIPLDQLTQQLKQTASRAPHGNNQQITL